MHSSDADVKTLLKDSGVILTADWASAGKQRVQTRSEHACALLWAPPFGAVDLHLSAQLTSYLQGLHQIREDHLKSSRWAIALASIVSANISHKGDTQTKTPLADGQPVSKRAARSAAAMNLLGAFSASSPQQSAAPQQQSAPAAASSAASLIALPQSPLQSSDAASLQQQQSASSAVASSAVNAAANPFSFLSVGQSQPRCRAATSPAAWLGADSVVRAFGDAATCCHTRRVQVCEIIGPLHSALLMTSMSLDGCRLAIA